MKKKIAYLTATALACVTIFGAASCGNKGGDSVADLEIYFCQSGAGTEYFEKIVDAFKVKNPDINVVEPLIVNSDYNYLKTALESGASGNSADLMFGYLPKFRYFQNMLEPIDDVLDSTLQGESMTIREKLGGVMKDFAVDGVNYYLPSTVSAGGIVYNKTLIDQTLGTDWNIPRTTTELAKLAADLKSEGVTPFIHNSNGGYWSYSLDVWWAQYSTVEEYNNFWQAKSGDKQPSLEVFKQEGRLKALEVLETLISPEGYVVDGSNSWTHTLAQTQFVNNRGAIMPNGGWLQNEIASNSAAQGKEFLMMKIPVISSLKDVLGIGESTLAKLVDYVDGVSVEAPEFNSSKGLTNEQVLQRVREARGVVATSSYELGAFIPNYATAKEAAKRFMKFFYSDEALQMAVDTLKSQPVAKFSDGREIDMSSWNSFMKSHFAYQQSGKYLFKKFSYELFYKTDLTESFVSKPELSLSAQGSAKKTAKEFFDDDFNDISRRWEQLLSIAGLK